MYVAGFKAVGPTVEIGATDSSQRVLFNPAISDPPRGAFSVRIHNRGDEDVFIEFGGSSVSASLSNSMSIAAKSVEVLSCGTDKNWVAAVAESAGPFKIRFTPGSGL